MLMSIFNHFDSHSVWIMISNVVFADKKHAQKTQLYYTTDDNDGIVLEHQVICNQEA